VYLETACKTTNQELTFTVAAASGSATFRIKIAFDLDYSEKLRKTTRAKRAFLK